MTSPSVTYPSFTSGALVESAKLNQNNADLLAAMTDGSKAFALAALTASSVSGTQANFTTIYASHVSSTGVNATTLNATSGTVTTIYASHISATGVNATTLNIGGFTALGSGNAAIKIKIASGSVVTTEDDYFHVGPWDTGINGTKIFGVFAQMQSGTVWTSINDIKISGTVVSKSGASRPDENQWNAAIIYTD